MNPIVRYFVALAIAWLLALALMIGSMIRQKSFREILFNIHHGVPELRLRGWLRVLNRIGTAGTQTAVGLMFVTIVVLIVLQFLSPPPSVAGNAARIDAIEKWIAEYDSLHKRGVP